MAAMGIREEEITVRFVKSSGRGGQKVNKTNSAVFLRHEPTGTSVKCGKSRSQHLNRFLALRQLLEKIEAGVSGAPDEADEKLMRLRKQKRHRQKKARQKAADATPASPKPENPEEDVRDE